MLSQYLAFIMFKASTQTHNKNYGKVIKVGPL
jgi:hypothetical protein